MTKEILNINLESLMKERLEDMSSQLATAKNHVYHLSFILKENSKHDENRLSGINKAKIYWEEEQIRLISEHTKLYKILNNGYSQ